MNVTMREFVKAVVDAAANGQNQHDVARSLGVSVKSVVFRIHDLLEKGVKIPNIISHPVVSSAADEIQFRHEIGLLPRLC
jgi:hypothetical protein